MKKVFLTAAAIFAFGFANAQDKKESNGEGFSNGDVFISGTAGISTSKTGDFKTNTSVFSPSVGFFVADNIAVGLSVGFQTAKVEVPGFDVTNSQTAVGVFGRYYTTPASKFSLFGQLGVNYLSYDNEFDGDLDPFADKGDGFNRSCSWYLFRKSEIQRNKRDH